MVAGTMGEKVAHTKPAQLLGGLRGGLTNSEAEVTT